MKNILLTAVVTSAIITSINAETLESTLSENDIFIGMSLGYSNLNSTKKDISGTVVLSEKLNDDSKNLNVEVGHNFNENIELSLNYQRVNNDDINLDNIYLSTKYKFKNENFTPYLGVNFGYSQLSWNKNPLNSSTVDNQSGSYLVGLSTGILYPVSKKLDLNLSYSLSHMGHKAILNPSGSNLSHLKHDYLSSLNVGFRYNF